MTFAIFTIRLTDQSAQNIGRMVDYSKWVLHHYGQVDYLGGRAWRCNVRLTQAEIETGLRNYNVSAQIDT